MELHQFACVLAYIFPSLEYITTKNLLTIQEHKELQNHLHHTKIKSLIKERKYQGSLTKRDF